MFELISDVVYGKENTRPYLLDVLKPGQMPGYAVPAVIFLHGGGWHMFGKYPQINTFLAEAGYVTISSNYRYSSQAVFPAQLEDAEAAVWWLKNNASALGIDPTRIGAWGISAGGHLASLLGVQGKVQAVVDICGVVDLFDPEYQHELGDPDGLVSQLLGGRVAENPNLALEASPAQQVSPGSAPFLILHGARDAHVPLSQSQRFHGALLRAGVRSRLEVFPDGDHFINETHVRQIEPMVLEFFRSTLGDPKP